MLATDRHLQGREHTAAVINWWLGRNGFSHLQAQQLAAWVFGDETWLQTSQLSHLRNGRMRAPQLKLFEGIAGMNAAIAGWRQDGQKACVRRWGPAPKAMPDAVAMDAATFLWFPGEEDRPLIFHDFADLFVGYLQLPYVDGSSISPGQSRMISERVGEELDRWMHAQGGIRVGLSALIRAYPVDDASRVAKLQQVIFGSDTYSAEELEEEAMALSQLFTELWKRPVCPHKLYGELAAGQRQQVAQSDTAARR